jgi:branched-chain amino acid transport system ATP-binding protein
MTPLLQVRDLDAFYATAHVLFDVAIDVPTDATVAVLGRNGAGKSTLMKSIVRAEVRTTGTIKLDGSDLVPLGTYRVARLGVALVPEDRRILSELTVSENLELGRQAVARERGALELDALLEIFPALKALIRRRGNELSGGEQQILAVARALVGNPRLLMLDEPSEGLAPVVIEQLDAAIRRLRRDIGVAVLLTEQNSAFALSLADRVVVLDEGRVVFSDTCAAFRRTEGLVERFLSV